MNTHSFTVFLKHNSDQIVSVKIIVVEQTGSIIRSSFLISIHIGRNISIQANKEVNDVIPSC